MWSAIFLPPYQISLIAPGEKKKKTNSVSAWKSQNETASNDENPHECYFVTLKQDRMLEKFSR